MRKEDKAVKLIMVVGGQKQGIPGHTGESPISKKPVRSMPSSSLGDGWRCWR